MYIYIYIYIGCVVSGDSNHILYQPKLWKPTACSCLSPSSVVDSQAARSVSQPVARVGHVPRFQHHEPIHPNFDGA